MSGSIPGSGSAASSSDPAPAAGPSKPKRVQNVSCDACRTRKVRCDRAARIIEWREANKSLPEARDPTFWPGTDVVGCSVCEDYQMECTLTEGISKRRIGRRVAALKAGASTFRKGASRAAPHSETSPFRPSKRLKTEPKGKQVGHHRTEDDDDDGDYEADDVRLHNGELGVLGVYGLTKTALDAMFMGYFAGAAACPVVIRYDEVFARYRAWWIELKTPSSPATNNSTHDTDSPSLSFALKDEKFQQSISLFDDNFGGDDLPGSTYAFELLKHRVPWRGKSVVPMPDVMVAAIATVGCGQLDKELYPNKLQLQRRIGRSYIRLSHHFLKTRPLGLSMSHSNNHATQAKVDAHDVLEAMLIVCAQDFDFAASHPHSVDRSIRHQPRTGVSRLAESACSDGTVTEHQNSELFDASGVSREAALRLATRMGLNRTSRPPSKEAAPTEAVDQDSTNIAPEIRKVRGWWDLFIMDSINSLLDRVPTIIDDDDFNLPLVTLRVGLPNELVLASGGQESNTPPDAVTGFRYHNAFRLHWMNTLFSLTFLCRGLFKRFVSVRAQERGVDVFDALNSIEVLERFYRTVPKELRWDHQDALLIAELAEMYPADAGSAYRPRRRVPNTVCSIKPIYRDALQSLFIESLSAAVVMSIATAVDDFGFSTSPGPQDPEPAAAVEAMLSGQSEDNILFRVSRDSNRTEPRFVRMAGPDFVEQEAATKADQQARLSTLASQQRSMQDATKLRMYVLALRYLFRIAHIFKSAADFGLLGASYCWILRVGQQYAAFGIRHVTGLQSSTTVLADVPASDDPLHRETFSRYPEIFKLAAMETGTAIDDTKLAVRDLIAGLAGVMDTDARAEPAVRALREQTKTWDQEELQALIEKQRRSGAAREEAILDQQPPPTPPKVPDATPYGHLPTAASAAAPSDVDWLNSMSVAQPSGSVPLGLDPFADLTQFAPAFDPNLSGDHSVGTMLWPELPPIGHLAGLPPGSGAHTTTTSYLFEQMMREICSQPASAPNQKAGDGPNFSAVPNGNASETFPMMLTGQAISTYTPGPRISESATQVPSQQSPLSWFAQLAQMYQG